MVSLTGLRLAAMMFLQFFVWGTWYVTAPRYLGTIGFDGSDFGLTYSVGPLAALVSPLFVGMVADRFFATERILGALHLLGAAIMYGATLLMNPADPATPTTINMVFFGHTLCYFPTLALTNSLAMSNIRDSAKEFPLVRVFGTIGWIAAGVAISQLGFGDKIAMFQLTAVSGVALGLYCFTLPHTPPPAKGQKVSLRELLGADALAMARDRSFAIFLASSFLICIPLAAYYQLAERALVAAGLTDTPFKMTFGQMSEILFMVAMPFFFKRLGVKWMLAVGMGAWVVRYGLFAAGTPSGVAWMMLAGVLLHGICYDFFFVTGQIYTDQRAPRAVRAQAQGLIAMLTLGLGMLIGAQAAGYIEKASTSAESTALSAEVQQLGVRIAQLEARGETGQAAALAAEQSAKAQRALETMDWQTIWLIPAALAGAILLMFVAIFRAPKPQS